VVGTVWRISLAHWLTSSAESPRISKYFFRRVFSPAKPGRSEFHVRWPRVSWPRLFPRLLFFLTRPGCEMAGDTDKGGAIWLIFMTAWKLLGGSHAWLMAETGSGRNATKLRGNRPSSTPGIIEPEVAISLLRFRASVKRPLPRCCSGAAPPRLAPPHANSTG